MYGRVNNAGENWYRCVPHGLVLFHADSYWWAAEAELHWNLEAVKADGARVFRSSADILEPGLHYWEGRDRQGEASEWTFFELPFETDVLVAASA